MKNPLLQIKFKNELKNHGDISNLEFYLETIKINGIKRGFSGFIKNKDNGRILYVNTEPYIEPYYNGKILYRSAKNLKDYTGGINNWIL